MWEYIYLSNNLGVKEAALLKEPEFLPIPPMLFVPIKSLLHVSLPNSFNIAFAHVYFFEIFFLFLPRVRFRTDPVMAVSAGAAVRQQQRWNHCLGRHQWRVQND